MENTTAQTGKKDKSKLLEQLGADFFGLLGGISIARSRRQIEAFYADEMDRIGEFPKQLRPENHHPRTDLTGRLSYHSLAEQIEAFALSVYRPSRYVTSEEAKRRLADEKQTLRFNQEDRERFLIGMIRTNFLKRLESSAHSLSETLGRTVGKIDDLVAKIDSFSETRSAGRSQADILPDDDDDDEEFLVNRARNPYHLRELDLPRWRADLLRDKETLDSAWQKVRRISPERDGKLRKIKEHISKQGK